MTEYLDIRRGNNCDSLTITIPKAIGRLYSLNIGDKIELAPMTTDSFVLRKVKNAISI